MSDGDPDDSARDEIVRMTDQRDRRILASGYGFGAMSAVLQLLEDGRFEAATDKARESLADLRALIFPTREGPS